jgi:hypothetical protein
VSVSVFVVVLLAGASVAAARGTIADRSPALRLVSPSPLVVAGVGFRSREHVTVTATTSLGLRSVRTRASERGTFRVLLGRFTQPCGKPHAVRARGARGSLAILRLGAQPCVPPPIP